jgi:hypothetical protein
MSAAMNGPANGPPKAPTLEIVQQHLKGLIEELQSRMMNLIHGKSLMDQEIATRKQGTNQTHRIQTLRQGRVINKGRRRTQKSMKKILRRHMIFKHDVNLLLRRYTGLFKQANQMLASLLSASVPTPLPQSIIDDANMLSEFYVRYHHLYLKIHTEHDSLRLMLDGENSNNSENSNNNAEQIPTITFGEPSFHSIPHREDATNVYLPEASSSSGGSRRHRTHHKRTRRNRA